MSNVYTFTTRLCGFVSVARDGGKFNNRSFAYQLPEDVLEQIEIDRIELLRWAATKSDVKRPLKAMTPWDKDGIVKFTYGAGDGSHKTKPAPQWVDMNDRELGLAALEAITKGTLVNITVRQMPYAMGPNIGTSLRVVKVQVVEETTSHSSPDLASVDPAVETPGIFTRSLADVIGSGVVFGLQDILDTYIPVVGTEQRNALIELVRNEANEYLDQEAV